MDGRRGGLHGRWSRGRGMRTHSTGRRVRRRGWLPCIRCWWRLDSRCLGCIAGARQSLWRCATARSLQGRRWPSTRSRQDVSVSEDWLARSRHTFPRQEWGIGGHVGGVGVGAGSGADAICGAVGMGDVAVDVLVCVGAGGSDAVERGLGPGFRAQGPACGSCGGLGMSVRRAALVRRALGPGPEPLAARGAVGVGGALESVAVDLLAGCDGMGGVAGVAQAAAEWANGRGVWR